MKFRFSVWIVSGLRHDQRRPVVHVDDREDAPDGLVDRSLQRLLGWVGVDPDHGRCAGRFRPGVGFELATVPIGHDDHGVDLADPHLLERLGLGVVLDVDTRRGGERSTQLGGLWRAVAVDPGEGQPRLAAALEDQPEHHDENERERQRPEQRGAVARIAPDIRDRERPECGHRGPVSPATLVRSG